MHGGCMFGLTSLQLRSRNPGAPLMGDLRKATERQATSTQTGVLDCFALHHVGPVRQIAPR